MSPSFGRHATASAMRRTTSASRLAEDVRFASVDDTIWVGMVDVRPGPDGPGGAYAYCAARAESVADAVGEIGAQVGAQGFELVAIEWLSRWAELSQPRRDSDAVAAVLAALADGNVALDRFFSYPEPEEHGAADLLKRCVQGFVEGWIDGAVESCGPFELGDFAFVAEMRFADEDPELGWAYSGALEHAPALFARASEVAEEEGED
jgi:hypothetical protein